MKYISMLAALAMMACSSPALPPSRVFNVAHASLVAIEVNFATTVSAPSPQITLEMLAELKKHAADSSTLSLVTELSKNPLNYLTVSASRSSSIETSYAGSGVLIGSHGSILTSNELLYPSNSTLAQLFLDVLPTPWLNTDLENLSISLAIALPLSSDIAAYMIATERAFLANYLKWGSVNRLAHATVTATYGISGPGKAFSALIVSKSNELVGLLKIASGPSLTPSLGLSLESPHKGDIVYVLYYSFPLTSASSLAITLDSALMSDVANNEFSLKLKNVLGLGGGAVLSQSGEILGVLNVINTSPSTSKGVPVSRVRESILAHNVDISSSQISTDLNTALDEYNLKHDSVSNNILRHIDILWPGDPVITKLIQTTNKSIKDGNDQTPFWYCYLNSSRCT